MMVGRRKTDGRKGGRKRYGKANELEQENGEGRPEKGAEMGGNEDGREKNGR
jgi:hypothetical protein